MTVNCAKKGHMKPCRKHLEVWFFRKCASCQLEKKLKEKDKREAKAKATQEKKETEMDGFFTRVMGRKKEKGKRSDIANAAEAVDAADPIETADPVRSPSTRKQQESQILTQTSTRLLSTPSKPPNANHTAFSPQRKSSVP